VEPEGRRTVAQRRGDAGERLVAERLVAAGWSILGRNLHLGRVEVDLLAVDPGPPSALVLVEVRWRAQRSFGLPEETIDWRKRRHLRAAMGRLLETGVLPDGSPLPALPFRIDVVALEPGLTSRDPPRLRHHRAAVGR
jgi:putative endonuclease